MSLCLDSRFRGSVAASLVLRGHEEEVLFQGFAYSILLDDPHLHPLDLEKVLSAFSLSRMPNFLLLVSVEGCNLFKDGLFNQEIYLARTPVYTILEGLLDADGRPHVSYNISNTNKIVVFLCQDFDEHSQTWRQDLSSLSQRMVDTVFQQLGEEISVVISDPCPNYCALRTAYRNCCLYSRSLVAGPLDAVRFAGQQVLTSGTIDKHLLHQWKANLICALDSFDEKKLCDAVDEVIGVLLCSGALGSNSKLQIINLLLHISDYYCDFVSEQQSLDELCALSSHIILGASYASTIKKVLMDFFSGVVQYIHSTYPLREKHLKQYLDQCFESMYQDAEFNISKMAQITGYNKSYFGKIFKKLYHCSFSAYLSQYRVEQSKALLQNTSLPIYMIAEHVGFRCESYYQTLFKSITGVTPNRYRASNRTCWTNNVSNTVLE